MLKWQWKELLFSATLMISDPQLAEVQSVGQVGSAV